jgi:hypothetical protein
MRLPPGIAALIAGPADWGTVQEGDAANRPNLAKSLVAAIQEGRLKVAPPSDAASSSSPSLPPLAPSDQPLPGWKRTLVDRCETLVAQPVRSNVELKALQAGILQMADHLTPSHEHSQSIEGRGKNHAGDYWHAINHRREPDYGNAKYWFRHVGNHPLFSELASVVPTLASEFPAGVQSKAQAVVERGGFDPFRFVDLVSEACRGGNGDLIRFCERLQWIEMVGLMEWTLKDATT